MNIHIHPKTFFLSLFTVLVAMNTAWGHGGHTAESPHFAYDPATVNNAHMTESPDFYQPALGYRGGEKRPWMTFLHFESGKGDSIWAAPFIGGQLDTPMQISAKPGYYAAPTLSGDWLTYEELPSKDGKWRIVAVRLDGNDTPGAPVVISMPGSHAINHRVAVAPNGDLWFVWQGENKGQYDVFARSLMVDGTLGTIEQVSTTPAGDWRPAVSVNTHGDVCVAWDGFTGESFDVLCRWLKNDAWGPVRTVAGTTAFEGRPDVATDSQGKTWITWEEGATGWGRPFRGVEGPWNNVTDAYGPVHRFRKLHVAALDVDGRLVPLPFPVPMPSFERAATQENRRPGATQLGVYYERPKLTVDASDRLWLTYRHFFQKQAGLAEDTEHHVEYGWGIYTRCLESTGWSAAYSFDIHQRDGMQRLASLPTEKGLLVAWATGRTDRRDDPMPRGIATGEVEHASGPAPLSDAASPRRLPETQAPVSNSSDDAPRGVAAPDLDIYYGDLHRHTDLSLCFPFFDGSIEDAYRYAIEVGGLNFLGITDHTRDLNHGDALAQLWWRCVKEARRHELDGAFMPLFAFERSHRETDHNVISLRDDRIQDFPPPLHTYWEDLGKDTFTIPHAPFRDRTWDRQDDAHRPLAEIYQGCRDYDSQEHVHKGLDKGYRIGFIASSDHLSTSASYACVWAPDGSREGIFRAMQARRTFGATTHIRLLFKAGEHWMGEVIESETVPAFTLRVAGTAPLELIEVLHNGKVVQTLDTKGSKQFSTEFMPDITLRGDDYIYIHLRQKDGNRAWSSPIWITAPKE